MSVAAGRSRVSSEQIDMLLNFMEDHLDFAAGRTSIYSRFSASKLWRLLAERLNAAAVPTAGACKSPDKWCRYWADLKYKARRKTAGSVGQNELSSVEERLCAILRSEAAAAGAPHAATDRRDEEEDVKTGVGGVGGVAGAGAGAGEDVWSDTSAAEAVPTEELVAEAAMRTALAAEKQAEAVAQGVELLRELVSLVRAGALGGAAGGGAGGAAGALQHAAPPPHGAHPHEPPLHHHRL